MKKYILLGIVLWLGISGLLAQLPNDECLGAIDLGPVSSYCSDPGAYTNIGATHSKISSDNGAGTCSRDTSDLDVWFVFEATATDANIRVIGELNRSSGGTLTSPTFFVYKASCTNFQEVVCASDGFGVNVVETFASDLSPGELYFIKVSGRGTRAGTFQLCLEQFNYVPEPKSDCPDGVILCDKSSFTIAQLVGAGNDKNEIDPSTCIQEEFSSVWYRWTCDTAGTLGFTLVPNNPTDDLDFAVYELPGGIDDCAGKSIARCVASGENTGEPFSSWERCTGATGLMEGDPNQTESPGCQSGDNNFANALNMVSGKSYALVVNNFSNTGNGFSISFNGTGTFKGPKPNFELSPETGLTCNNDQLTVTNLSTTTPGATSVYEWYFGSFASQLTGTGVGPFTINYGGYGDKNITLRLTSSEGCVVTKTKKVFVEPCCETATPLKANPADVTDPQCPGTPTGSYEVSIATGDPEYFFSLNGGKFLKDTRAINLYEGTYTIYARNIKGCFDTLTAVLKDPPSFSVEAGPDQNLDFGGSFEGQASTDLPGNYKYIWSGAKSVNCLNDDCSRATIVAAKSGLITVTAVNEFGCETTDQLRVDVRLARPFFAPSAFSPNNDGTNDKWTVYIPEEVVSKVVNLRIFDRWGNMVFTKSDFQPNDITIGWDGTTNGKNMNSGVYAFVVEVEYLDGKIVPFTGDITIVR